MIHQYQWASLTALAFNSLASPGNAYSLERALLEPAKATYSTARPLYDVERCLLVIDFNAAPVIYRAPDRPNESIFYLTTTGGAAGVIALRRVADTTYFDLKTALADAYQKKVASCQ